MAFIKSGTLGSGAPLLAYELYAEQVGASGTRRTVKITANFKVNGSSNWWYGYACNWRARVHNSYGGWSAIKGTESWNGGQSYRTFTQTLTVDVGTTSSTSIVVGLQTGSQIDYGWDGSATGSFTVGSTNVPPVISGTVDTYPSGVIPENTGSITVTSPYASDVDGNLSGYRCRVSINGGGYTEIYRGASRSFSHNVGAYGGGTTFKYCFDAYDSAGAWSGAVYSGVVTKNVLNNGWFTGHSNNVDFNTKSFTLYFNRGSNNNGVATKTLCYSDNVTVYNQVETTSGTSQTILIWRNGDATPANNQPYIKFDDLKNYFRSSNYRGNLHIGLRIRNDYGSTKWLGWGIQVNLQTTPNAVGSCSIATDANSTAYKTVSSTGNKYFIPDDSSVIRVNWDAGSGKLGEGIFYELFVAYGSGGWSKVASLDGGAQYYNHVVPKQNISQAIKYKVRTVTEYGTYADRNTSAKTLHYYNPPSLATGTLTRGATTCDAEVTIKSLSSIPNINTVGTWNCYNKGTSNSVSSGNLTLSQEAQTIKVTKLTDDGQYDLKVTFKDDTGFSSNATVTVTIGANSPIFFINKYGVGINGLKADSKYGLKINGDIKSSGINTHALNGDNDLNTYKSNKTWVCTTRNTSVNRPEDWCTVLNVGAEYNSNFQLAHYYGGGSTFYVRGRHDTSGNYTPWAKVYTDKNKPTPADIGAMADKGTYETIKLNNWIRTNGNTGWHSETYGGGWHMTDSTWIRSYGSKNVYVDKSIRADGGYQLNGGKTEIKNGETNTARIQTPNGWIDIGSLNSSFCHFQTDKPGFHFYKKLSVGGNVELYDSGQNFIARNNYGFMSRDTGGNPRYLLYMDNSNSTILGYNNERYIKSYGHFVPVNSRAYWLGTNSPNAQWKGVCCEGGTVGASDGRVKENMVRLDGTQVSINEKSNTIKETRTVNKDFNKATPNDYYEFIKDRFKPTYYNYKPSSAYLKNSELDEDVKKRVEEDGYEPAPQITVEEEYKLLKNVGFIAQDYDLKNDKVAQEFIFENSNGDLSYNHMSYVTVGMVALQEATKKIERLEEENKKLKEDLEKIKDHLNID